MAHREATLCHWVEYSFNMSLILCHMMFLLSLSAHAVVHRLRSSWLVCVFDLCASSFSVLTNVSALPVCPGVCLCHQPQLPSCFKLKHKHLKHFSCVVLVQFMQLKTGPTHPQSWCYSNSVTLLEIRRLKENWSYARTDSEHPFHSMQLFFIFYCCFVSLNEACMHICQQVSTRWTAHQIGIDTWTQGPLSAAWACVETWTVARACPVVRKQAGPLAQCFHCYSQVKSAHWCYIPSAQRLDDQGGTKPSVSYALLYICKSVFLKHMNIIISWPAVCLIMYST